MRVFFCFFAACCSATALAQTYEGRLAIPDGPTLPIGVEFITMADGSPGANVVSMAQGQRYMASHLKRVSEAGFEIEIPGIAGTIFAEKKGGSYQATLSQGGAQFEFTLEPVDSIAEPVRPQTPDLEVGSEDVAIENAADGVWLSGTLTRADGTPRGAVVLIGGSGPTQRDEYHSAHRPFAVIAHVLSEAGFSVLRYDKRGVYKSTGAFVATDIHATARDAVAVTRFMKRQMPDLPLGLVGHSEGGLVAGMVAKETDVDFIVSLAGAAIPVIDLFSLQDRTEALAAGATPEQAGALEVLTARLYESARRNRDPQTRNAQWQEILGSADDAQSAAFAKYNGGTGTLSGLWASQPTYSDLLEIRPMAFYADLGVPMLWVMGGLDVQVPSPENLHALVSSANTPVQIAYLPKLNHMLQPAATGATSEYAEIEVSVAEPVLDAITGFADAHAAPER